MKRKHNRRVWRVGIASVEDEKLRDRFYTDTQRLLVTCKLPERESYLIEAGGHGAIARKKAIALAIKDGIPKPIVRSIELLTA